MRKLVLSLALLLIPDIAVALSGAATDSTDRFPYVVEIKLDDRLICSGTVLYPRIVVTAAHCLQEKVYWRGVQFYEDNYLAPEGLSVEVVREGREERFDVAETAISPSWRALIQNRSVQRFPYDLALVITKQPIAIDRPARAAIADGSASPGADEHGVLVAFGGAHCASAVECADAGIRRVLPVTLKEKAYCFRNPLERDLLLGLRIWCMDQLVMPGDSGGALLIEDSDGKLNLAGVISAHQEVPPEIAAMPSWRRSLAADIEVNRPFIEDKARELGYPSP